jgi:hypothetical protein
MDFMKINCRYGDIDSAASFNILHDILPGPLALLELTYQIGKKYWKYVKAIKRETVGVSTLKVNGETSNNTTTNQQDNYRIGKKYWKYEKSRAISFVGIDSF